MQGIICPCNYVRPSKAEWGLKRVSVVSLNKRKKTYSKRLLSEERVLDWSLFPKK